MSLNQDQVLEALKQVQDPDLKKDLVTLGMIQDLDLSQPGKISLRVVLTTPACPLKEKIKADVVQVLEKLPGVQEVQVQMDAQVRRSGAGVGTGAIPGVKNVIAVSSGKGGVGKSTVAVNLAVSLALDGAKVGLIDADVYGPNGPTLLGVTEEPRVIQGETPSSKDRLVPPTAYGIRVMSMGFLVKIREECV